MDGFQPDELPSFASNVFIIFSNEWKLNMIVYLEKESTTVEFRFIFSSVGNGDGYMPAEILAVSD